jgi:polyhydroxyalkanoate synthesis regulator phasin
LKNNQQGGKIMQNERLQVLKMVEDGKITVDEATKLLESLHVTNQAAPSGPGFEEKFKDFACDMKEFAKDVTCKINEMTKKAEPKIKEFTKTVAAKTANLADNISQSLNEKIKNMDDCCECECSCNENCDPICQCDPVCCEEEVTPADNGPAPTENESKE